MSSVETGQMSAVETGQMSAAETGQVSAAETGQMSVEVSKSQLFKSQLGGLSLIRRKWFEMGPEWSPGPENRSPGFSRTFPRLWDRSRGPKPPK